MSNDFKIPEPPTDSEVASKSVPTYYVFGSDVGEGYKVGMNHMRNEMLPHYEAAKIMFEALNKLKNGPGTYVSDLSNVTISKVIALYTNER